MFGAEAATGLDLMRTHELGGHTFGELAVEVRVTGSVCLGLVVFGEAFLAVFADGLEQPVPGLEPAVLGDHQ